MKGTGVSSDPRQNCGHCPRVNASKDTNVISLPGERDVIIRHRNRRYSLPVGSGCLLTLGSIAKQFCLFRHHCDMVG